MKVKIKYGSLEELETKEEKMYKSFQRYANAMRKRDEKILKHIAELEEILNNQPWNKEEYSIRLLIREIKKELNN